jgi:hypothetical protein
VEFSNGWSGVVSLTSVYIAIAAGVLMMLVSLLGCAAGRKNQNKVLVFIYLVLVCGVLALEIAAAVLAAQYAGLVNVTSSSLASSLEADANIEINNSILSLYTSCCSGCPAGAGCNNTLPNFGNTTGIGCTNVTVTCELVPVCSGSVNDTCYQFLPGSVVDIPPFAFDNTFCSFFENLHLNGTSLVGPADSGSCGRGNPQVFEANVFAYLKANMVYIIIGFAVIAGIQGLVVISIISILCFGNRDEKE